MRKQLLGLFVPLLAMVLVASAADMTGKGVTASAALQRLEVTHSQDGLRVEFKAATGSLTPKMTTLDSPARIVVDFPNTVMATSQSHIGVGKDGVDDVRIGMDGLVPPTTRVVIDLAADCRHELVAGRDGSFVLEIHGAPLAHRQTAPAKSPAANATAATSAQLIPASAKDATLAPASVQNPDKPAEFAFVEPKYSVKDDQTAPPVAKAQEARLAVSLTRLHRNWSPQP